MDYYRKLSQKIKSKNATVGVIGLGYVGLSLAINFCNAGYSVLGFDIDNKKVKSLNNSKSYISYFKSSKIRTHINQNRFVSSPRKQVHI